MYAGSQADVSQCVEAVAMVVRDNYRCTLIGQRPETRVVRPTVLPTVGRRAPRT